MSGSYLDTSSDTGWAEFYERQRSEQAKERAERAFADKIEALPAPSALATACGGGWVVLMINGDSYRLRPETARAVAELLMRKAEESEP